MFTLYLALMSLTNLTTSYATLEGFKAEKTCQMVADELTADAKKRWGDGYTFVAVCTKDPE